MTLPAEAQVPSHSDQFRRTGRWLLATSTVLMVCIVAGGGLPSAGAYLFAFAFPAGLFFALQRATGGNRVVSAALVVLFVGSTVVLAVWVKTPAHMPPLDACLVSLFAAVSILGFGLFALGRLDLSPGVFSVTLLLTLAIAAQTAIAVAAGPDRWAPFPVHAATEAILVGVAFFFASPLFRARELNPRYFAFAVGAGTISVIYSLSLVSSFFPPYAMFSKVHLSSYQVELAFDPAKDGFVAEDAIAADFEWVDDGDVVRQSDGSLAPWSAQAKMQKKADLSLLQGFALSDVAMEISGHREGHDIVKVYMRLRRQGLAAQTQKDGALFYLAEFPVPLAVGLTPSMIAPGAKAEVEINVLTPEYFGLRHNLEGEQRDGLLPSGAKGLSLRATKVNDLWGVIRLRYPISVLRNPILEGVAKFNGWTWLLGIQALVFGAMGFMLAIVGDVLKDAALKPKILATLVRLKIVDGDKRKERRRQRRAARDAPD